MWEVSQVRADGSLSPPATRKVKALLSLVELQHYKKKMHMTGRLQPRPEPLARDTTERAGKSKMASQKGHTGKVDVQTEEHIVGVSKDSQDTPTKNEEDGPRSKGTEPVLDYAGSAAKVDPEEIRLVRKLDYMMLVSNMK